MGIIKKIRDYFIDEPTIEEVDETNLDPEEIAIVEETKQQEEEVKKNTKVQLAINEFVKEIQEVFDSGIFGYSTYGEVLQSIQLAEVQRNKLDPQIKASMKTLIYSALKKVPKFIVKGETEEANQLVDFCNIVTQELEDDMKRGISSIISSMFDTSVYYGFIIGEKVYKIYNDENFQSKRIYTSLSSLRIGQFGFKMSKTNKPIAIKSLFDNSKFFPLNKFFWLTFDPEFDNPYGSGVVEYVNRLSWAKSRVFKQYLLYLAKKSVTPVIVKVDDASDPSTIDQGKKVLKVLQNGGGTIVSKDMAYELEFPQLTDETSYLQCMDFIDSQIAKAITGNTLSTNEAKSSTGTFAQAKVHMEVTTIYTDFIEKTAIDFLKHHIYYPLLKYNFDKSKWKRTIYPDIELVDPKAKVIIPTGDIATLKTNGFISSTRTSDVNKVREMYDFTKLTDQEVAQQDNEKTVNDQNKNIPL